MIKIKSSQLMYFMIGTSLLDIGLIAGEIIAVVFVADESLVQRDNVVGAYTNNQ
jgi:hypothetical protein